MEERRIRFSQLLEQHLVLAIQKKFSGQAITPTLLREIRDEIRARVGTVLGKSSLKLSPEAIGWVSNQLFGYVKLNAEQVVGELVVVNDYKLADMPTHELVLLHNVFDETKMGPLLVQELERRRVSQCN